MMNQHKLNQKKMRTIEEIINQFPNGVERFNNDALFNTVVMSLYYGEDPIKIIDSLIKSNNEITESFRNHLLNSK
jgi:methanogenic corrinoid protein MtbC1